MLPKPFTTLFLPLLLLGGILPAQIRKVVPPPKAWAENVIIPQARFSSYRVRQHIPAPPTSSTLRPWQPPNRISPVHTSGVTLRVEIKGQMACTTMDIHLVNKEATRQEAELLVPVPAGAVIKGFTFQGSGSEPTASLLTKEAARHIYDGLVAKVKDPALLEFANYNLIRTSVFPVEPMGKQQLRLVFEQLLPATGERIDYFIPRSESLSYSIPWQIRVHAQCDRPISTVYSPSHHLISKRHSDKEMTIQVAARATTEPGAFRLSLLLQKNGMSATLMAYPDPKIGGGYFLMLLGLPALPPKEKAIKREVTLVLDRSGSMSGKKLEQALAASKQVLGGLEPGETFNLIAYNNGVDLFSPKPVVKTPATCQAAYKWLTTIRPRGGTNIHDALLEALRQEATPGALPLVLFLTDGVPTLGQTSEVAIREMAAKANTKKRRIFTFGVGVDVNTPLLTKIASQSRATATFVLPREDVEVKVSDVFAKLSGPVLANPTIGQLLPSGFPALNRIRQILPTTAPDLFLGDQLVVLGQYLGDDPIAFTVKGNYRGQPRTFHFSFKLKTATTRNNFVPRLWASRKIAQLTDAIRDMGADQTGINPTIDPAREKRFKELVDEIVRLSVEFGILTEYTSFLAREGFDFSRPQYTLNTARTNFRNRAMLRRSGLPAVVADNNNITQGKQFVANGRNWQYDANNDLIAYQSVQQVADRTLFRSGNRWIDSRLVGKAIPPDKLKIIIFGSPEYFSLARQLASEGRAGTIALGGEILLSVAATNYLIKAPQEQTKKAEGK